MKTSELDPYLASRRLRLVTTMRGKLMKKDTENKKDKVYGGFLREGYGTAAQLT
jgi:hypothetical protein